MAPSPGGLLEYVAAEGASRWHPPNRNNREGRIENKRLEAGRIPLAGAIITQLDEGRAVALNEVGDRVLIQ
jgi:hypothetical protein